MPNTYVQDIKQIVDAMSRDEGLPIEGRLILLGMVMDYITAVSKELEDELATGAGGQTH